MKVLYRYKNCSPSRYYKDILNDKEAQRLSGLLAGTEKQWDKLCQQD